MEERRKYAVLFFHRTNSSKALGDESSVYSLPASKTFKKPKFIENSMIYNVAVNSLFQKNIDILLVPQRLAFLHKGNVFTQEVGSPSDDALSLDIVH